MSEKQKLQILTELAMLDCLALSLIGLQSVVPLSFALFVILVSVLFALEMTHAPFSYVLLSGLTFVGTAFLMFGVVVGCWACCYVLLGMVCGALRRTRLHMLMRMVASVPAAAGLLGALIWVFAGLAGVQVKRFWELPQPIPCSMMAACGVAVLTVVILVDLLLSRVLAGLAWVDGAAVGRP